MIIVFCSIVHIYLHFFHNRTNTPLHSTKSLFVVPVLFNPASSTCSIAFILCVTCIANEQKMSLSTTQLSFPDTITMDTPTFSNIATMDTGPLPITNDLHIAYQSAVDIQCIQFQLDCHVKDLSAQLKSSIPFLCSVTYDNTTPASQISLLRFLYHSLTYLTIWVDRNIPRVG